MKRTRLWRWAVVIIIGLFLLAGMACGKKGDPIPPKPEQPKTGTSAEQPQQPKADTTPEQPGIQPGATPGK